MQQYREDSVKMLDVCCLLKETLAGADAYVKASRLALQRLHQGDISRAKHALLSAKKQVQESILPEQYPGAKSVQTDVKAPDSTKRLSACSSMLRRMGDKLSAPPTASFYVEEVHTASMALSSALPAALYGGEICTLFFLRLLSTALSSTTSPATNVRTSSMDTICPLSSSATQRRASKSSTEKNAAMHYPAPRASHAGCVSE